LIYSHQFRPNRTTSAIYETQIARIQRQIHPKVLLVSRTVWSYKIRPRFVRSPVATLDPMNAGGSGVTVHKENVLAIGAAFHAEAKRIEGLVGEVSAQMVTTPALGDPASADYAAALSQLLVHNEDSYVERARAYVTELRGVATQCEESARAYGFTDEEIRTAFRG
jgi:hypothetical protein